MDSNKVASFWMWLVATLLILSSLNQCGHGMGIPNAFKLISERLNVTEAEQECRDLGYDGLAIIKTPEEFNYVLKISQPLRKNWGLWVALRHDSSRFVWDDGTLATSDLPWYKNQKGLSENATCCRLNVHGGLRMLECYESRFAVCGRHTRNFSEAGGSTHDDERPRSMTSPLSQVMAASYLQCAALCSANPSCRIGVFNTWQHACALLGPGSSTELEQSPGHTTFVRHEFIQEW